MTSIVPFVSSTSFGTARRGRPEVLPRRILAATDLSTRSHRALRRAGTLLRDRIDAELCLLHVADGSGPDHLVRKETAEARRMLEEQIASVAELRGIRCRALVSTGRPHEQIVAAAEAEDADLIVMGTHRRRLLDGLLSDTTVERVIRSARCPVLVADSEPYRSYERILVPVDTTEASANAIRAADALGLVRDGGMTLLHAFTAFAKGKLSLAGVRRNDIADYVAAERDQAYDDLRTFLEASGLGGRRWMVRLAEGGPFEVIAREVERGRPDLVVLGTHGRSGLPRVLLGSVTDEALRSLDVDILVMPAGGRCADGWAAATARNRHPAEVARPE